MSNHKNCQNLRVLVVDDCQEQGEAEIEFLNFSGFHADGIFSASGLNDVFEFHIYDLVVINVMTHDGYEIAKNIRQNSDRVGVVLVIAEDAPEHGTKAFRSGADNYLVRPYDFNLLLAIIKSLARRLL